MDHIGPFYFNGIRFAIGSLSLLPLILVRMKRMPPRGNIKSYLLYGSLAGLCLMGGASLQQLGIMHTTAGNAGFITGLYVILVPLSAIFWRVKTPFQAWLGALFALSGLYLLSFSRGLEIGHGDFLVLLGTLFWTAHFHVLAWASPKADPLILSSIQFLFCALASLGIALFTETLNAQALSGAALPIIYGGLMPVGVAYTLQVIAQREAPASHASIILSLEGAFAALGGWLLLNESFSSREGWGCVLMFSGMVLAQWPQKRKGKMLQTMKNNLPIQ